jgi:hypothetical protein
MTSNKTYNPKKRKKNLKKKNKNLSKEVKEEKNKNHLLDSKIVLRYLWQAWFFHSTLLQKSKFSLIHHQNQLIKLH